MTPFNKVFHPLFKNSLQRKTSRICSTKSHGVHPLDVLGHFVTNKIANSVANFAKKTFAWIASQITTQIKYKEEWTVSLTNKRLHTRKVLANTLCPSSRLETSSGCVEIAQDGSSDQTKLLE